MNMNNRKHRYDWLRIAALIPAVVAASAGTCVNVGDGTGFPRTTPWAAVTIDQGENVRPSVVLVEDLDRDTRDDVIVGYAGVSPATPGVTLFFREADDTLTAVTLSTDAILSGLEALATGDLDGDDAIDVVASCDGRLVYLHSGANPREASGWTASVIEDSSGQDLGQWQDVAIGDIDGLNGPDIVAACENAGRVAWFVSPADDVPDGAGWTRVDIDATTRSDARGVALADLDGDGRMDVVSTAAGEDDDRICWYRTPADPATQAWTKFPIGNLPGSDRMILADLDADGRSDVIVLNPGGRQAAWYQRPADATTAWTGFLIAEYETATPVDLRATDVDGNGQVDVIVATRQPGSLRWFTPLGATSDLWTENIVADPAADVDRFAVAEFTGDERRDIVAPLIADTTDGDRIERFENPED